MPPEDSRNSASSATEYDPGSRLPNPDLEPGRAGVGSRPFDRRYASLGPPMRSNTGLFSLNSRQDFHPDEAGLNIPSAEEKLQEAVEQETDPNLIVFEGPDDPINPQASVLLCAELGLLGVHDNLFVLFQSEMEHEKKDRPDITPGNDNSRSVSCFQNDSLICSSH
jgi:hypothetical protein